MPILQAFGPSTGGAPVAAPVAGAAHAARRYGVLPMPALEWNAQVERETAHLYDRVRAVIPAVEWPFFAPYVKAINALKQERNAVILAHTRRRKSTTASPISSGTRSSSRARRPRSMPRSSSNAACISWPRRRRSSTPTRPC